MFDKIFKKIGENLFGATASRCFQSKRMRAPFPFLFSFFERKKTIHVRVQKHLQTVVRRDQQARLLTSRVCLRKTESPFLPSPGNGEQVEGAFAVLFSKTWLSLSFFFGDQRTQLFWQPKNVKVKGKEKRNWAHSIRLKATACGLRRLNAF